ncbi:MAG: TonB-dependent receptor plug domain-containing protein [Bacteroidales bacterium]|nr:TonB-dependent receptor plug domain-containing protein [Bacteroidales bacterium]
MKRIGIIILLIVLSSSLFAQETIKGIVLNEVGELLIGANVVIKESQIGTATNSKGEFSFSKITSGDYTFVISYLGFEALEKKLTVPVSEELVIILKRSSIWSDEVIVSATRAGEKTPMAYSNISNEEIKKNNTGNDIPYILSMTPSLVETSEAGIGIGYTSMRIRGIDPTRINVTINGIPLNDAESHGVYWVNLPDIAASVQDIQIQRGVGSSTNGSGAFGASINLRTNNINYDPYTEINSTFGSFNTFKNSVQIGTGLIKDKFSFDGRFSNVQSDGYVDYSGSKHESFFLSGTYYKNKTLIKANIFRGKEKTGISWWGIPEETLETNRTYNPAGEYVDINGNTKYYEDQTDNYTQTHYQLILSNELSKSLNFNLALHYTKGEGYYEQYKESDEFSSYNLPNILLGDSILTIGSRTLVFPDSTIANSDIIRRKWMDNDFYGVTYSLNYNKKNIDAIIGGAWNKYDGDHFGTILWSEFSNNIEKDYEWYNNNGTKTDFNIFGKINYTVFSKLHIYGDLQYRNVRYKMIGIDDDFKNLEQSHNYDFFNPKAGLFFDINNQFNSYFSVAVANREPTRSDFKNAIGDDKATPKHETLYDFELGGNYKSENLLLSANLYYMMYYNQLVNTGKKSSVGYDIQDNVDDSYRTGIELVSNLKINDFLSWQVNLTLSSNKINNFIEYSDYSASDWTYMGNLSRNLGKTDISYSPEIIGSNILSVKPINQLEISIISKYVGKQYFDNTSDENRMLDPYFINNLKISFSPKVNFVKYLGIFLQVNNFLNAKYVSNAYGGNWYENANSSGDYLNANEGSWAAYYPQAGVNILGGISLKF